MTFTDSIKTCLNKYATFSGRASRSEYWWFYLFFILLYVGLAILSVVVSEIFSFGMILVLLGLLLPSIAASIRRLHDVDKSGWWMLISIVPLFGLILIYFLSAEGSSGDNQFGPAPAID